MKNITILLFVLLSHTVFAQISDGTVRSLVNTEEYFNFLVKEKGINKGFQKVIAPKCLVFRPNPVSAKQYFRRNDEDKGQLSWKPEFAMIAKNGDFGFTTGPYSYNNKGNISYGHYISIWKSDDKNRWRLVLDVGIPHEKPTTEMKYEYLDPQDHYFNRLLGPQKLKMREDIVYSTDLLLGKALFDTGLDNFNEFYDNQVRLYFPHYLPFLGKYAAIQFFKSQNFALSSSPTFIDRAFSGDLAYTYGTATISGKVFNYVRIWKISESMKWNIIMDVYLPSS
ncbi:MAG: hypothetical protein IE931_08665 [Sphingobacteriales bacterium]|nr:hypothetical protein [Sphingobacteriales bacterium]